MQAWVKRCALFACSLLAACAAHTRGPVLDDYVTQGMARTHAQGLAVAVIDNGKVTRIGTWGKRNDKGDPLTPDTVMYGASLTKAVFAYTVMQLVEEGKLDLDTSIAAYLPKPLPDYTGEGKKYAAWEGLAGDERWRKLTPRIFSRIAPAFPISVSSNRTAS